MEIVLYLEQIILNQCCSCKNGNAVFSQNQVISSGRENMTNSVLKHSLQLVKSSQKNCELILVN